LNQRTLPLAAAVLGSGLFVLTGQQPGPAPSGIFTEAQAEAGRAAYENTCGQCHTPTLMGRKGAPGELPPLSALSAKYQEFIGPRGYVAPLAGKTFIDRWGSKTAAQLIARFQETVPAFPPEGMNDETTVNITAYILQVNGAKPGTRPLTRTASDIVSSVVR
jgi:mono/diheme cytochrome c family protein